MGSKILRHALLLPLLGVVSRAGCEAEGDSDPTECHALLKENLRHLGTKSPYRFIANQDSLPPRYEGCSPNGIVGIFRHGTRTPGLDDARKIRDRLNSVRTSFLSADGNRAGSLCPTEAHNLSEWTFPLDSDEGKTLTREGSDEMFQLAKRFQQRFPELLPSTYDNAHYLLKFTKTERADKSARSFAAGLLSANESLRVRFPEPLDQDPILRFYKLCKRWKFDVKSNQASTYELNSFKQTEEADEMVERVSSRLGLNASLSFDDVNLMYRACAYQVAWSKEDKSAWCSVFSAPDIEVLEYAEDIKYYWRDGYGFDVNYKQACVLTRNITDLFEGLSSGNGPRAIFYFTHSGTLLKLISHLGLYRDPFVLTHNLSSSLKQSRRWRVSLIDPFGSNLVFVLFRCSSNETKVQTLHQERTVHVEGCPPGDLCPLDVFSRAVASDSCDFPSICKATKHEL